MSRPIDADELSRRMYNEAFEKDSEDQRLDSGCWIRYRLFEKILKEQPTIESERKVGKWIDHSDDGYVECPFCGNATNCDDNIDELHYCFSCGAKMRGEEDG